MPLRAWARDIFTGMDRGEAIRRIQGHEARLRDLGVASLSLFGSVARDEAGPDSDIDMLVAFDGPATFDQFMDLKLFLEDLLGARVDLVTEKGMRSRVREEVQGELLRVA
ncbi:MAG: nucleotidyltransferase family protein [Myxococcota bacterium]